MIMTRTDQGDIGDVTPFLGMMLPRRGSVGMLTSDASTEPR